MAFRWQCPYCSHDTTIGPENFIQSEVDIRLENKHGYSRLHVECIICPNDECQKMALIAVLKRLTWANGVWNSDETLEHWNLLPKSHAKVFPDYIPTGIIRDYEEACEIVNASPKASATLSRRCLLGIIRDFWGVSKSRLIDEINSIKERVDPLTWNAIDAIRKVGNIGAHMEKDINLIIEVDPEEASLLIRLIELLLKEWYVHRHERQEQLNAIIALSKEKDTRKEK